MLHALLHRRVVAAVTLAAAAVTASPLAADPGTPKSRAVRSVTITARDFAFQMVDTLDAGATEFVLKNLGPELHHAQLVRIEGNHTLKDVLEAAAHHGPPPSWAVLAGGPNTPNPGGESRGIVDLRPGKYALLCVIPSADGKPHVAKGMVKEFVVRPAKNRAVMPKAEVTLTLSDYAFTWSKPLAAGKTMLAVTTAPRTQPHEVVIAKLAPGKSLKDALTFLEKMAGPPPMSMIGGTVGVVAGDRMLVPLDLTPGEYVLLCMFPDAKDGKPHVMHGMSQQFTVR